MTAEQLSELREEIGGYLEKDGSDHPIPMGAPITYVPKKDNTHRLVFDYRRLNKVTLPDASLLPRIDDLLSTIARAHVYSKIDLKQGYNQIPMDEEAIPLTAFVTPVPHSGGKPLRMDSASIRTDERPSNVPTSNASRDARNGGFHSSLYG